MKQNVSSVPWCPFVSKMDKLCIAVNHKINIFYINFLWFLLIKLTYTSFPSGNYYIFSSIGF